jgi:selenocysteine-specific elongation factor
MPREDLREAAQVKNARLFGEMIESMAGVVTDGPLVRLATHTVTLTLEQEAARDILLQQIGDSGFSPPSIRSLEDTHGTPLVRALIDGGALIKVTEDIAFTEPQLDEAKRLIAEGTQRIGPLTTSQIREILGTSRKYAIPLLEYLDREGFTRRSGEVRDLVR